MTIRPVTIQKGQYGDMYGNFKNTIEGKRTSRKPNWVEGWWENITTHPIYIRDKRHLKEVCTKYGVIPKAFMKPKSQGKGVEWTY